MFRKRKVLFKSSLAAISVQRLGLLLTMIHFKALPVRLLHSQLMMIMIKVSDISNEARPMDVAEPWLDCLLQEFFNQVAYYKYC